jgi:signal transduction histidine kinase
MLDSEKLELQRLALAAEMARYVAHDCSNFLYNFFLQLEIWETLPDVNRPNWARIKSDAEKLANLLQQWHRARAFRPSDPQNVDFAQLLRATVAELKPLAGNVQIECQFSSEPIWITMVVDQAQRLCFMLLEGVLNLLQGAPEPSANVVLRVEADPAKVLLYIAAEHPAWHLLVEKYSNAYRADPAAMPSLLVGASRSMADRIDVRIRTSEGNEGAGILVLEFPVAFS